ncbi:hypothetical protein L596_010322 [Steinernema carpocapsae]|uniref:Uncharacterized protein n=1 Tax=Steinernema carpocapsae TaxID=34508 RepID=A0A4U5PII9_STECR|nr:hypothetical protein L596_010322 [Steinernema carpocapsae]
MFEGLSCQTHASADRDHSDVATLFVAFNPTDPSLKMHRHKDDSTQDLSSPSRRSFCSSTSSEDSPPASPTWSTASSSKSLRCPCLAKQGTSTVVHSELGSSMRGGRKQSVQESPPSSPIFKAPFIVGTASSSSSCYQLHANVQSLLHTVKVNYPMYHSLVMAVVAAPGGTTNMCQKLIAAFDERIKLIENAMDNLWRISKKHKSDAGQNHLIAEKFYHLYDEVDRCREKRWDLSYLTYSLNEKGNALSLPRNRISQIKLIQKVFADKSL